MMITQWKQIRSLFESVCDLDPEEREARLSATCAGDPELRAEVESLLTASEEASEGLDVPAAETFREVIRSDEAERLVGGRVGAYQLVRLIACGGMGSVYYATPSDDPHGHAVAVKLIAPRLRLSDDIVRRFHREQRTLAKLDHPNIGRLLDGGVAEGDTPYLVMEFVDGAPIDQFCDEHRLSISRRLVLFRAVCAAVQFAHRNLVVHRDLKPSNILVTPNGVPKLLDFGIAKLIEEDPDRALETTLDGPRLMTPAYASPEQLRGHTITTASDVYSLGVILYELLTGHRPYNLTTRSLHEVERVICESNPKKPSTAILETTLPRGPEGATRRMVTPDTVSRARSDTPDALRRRLAGDLDAIVLVAMRKEPERRYASVELFSEDIRRYLDGMPVSARRDTVRYRCAKFARRNKIGLIAGTVVLLAALGVLFNTVHSEHRARRDAAKTQQVNRFLNEMFASVGMGITAESQPTVRRVLDGAADKLATGALSGQPEVEAAVRMTIGATYLELGLYDWAEPHLTTALEIRLAQGSNPDAGVADSLDAMGLLNKEMGRYDQAERFYRESLETRRDLFGADHLSTAETMNNLGVLLRKRGRLEEAEHLLRGALQVRRTQLGNADEAVATTSTNLGAVLK
ncbi:MAG: serine/threonine protein kinase, partial [Planctomycetes bacterium]|nr:serine/threonine protein kinase [Planctomycetota bacterium]